MGFFIFSNVFQNLIDIDKHVGEMSICQRNRRKSLNMLSHFSEDMSANMYVLIPPVIKLYHLLSDTNEAEWTVLEIR